MTTDLERLRSGALAGARTLDLSGCGLAEVPPEVFGLSDTLEILDLGRNPLEDLPADLARLRRLRILSCSGTRMRVLPPVLGDCAALTQIGCRGSGVEIVPEEALPPALRWLTLTDNRIATLPDAIGERPSLQKLMLAGNRLARLPGTLAGAPSLELLRLSSNALTEFPSFLLDLPRLAWLALSANPFLDAAAPAPPPPPPPPPPPRILRWAALTQGPMLGEGASGRVHDARLAGSATPVALKLFKSAMTSDGPASAEIEASLAIGPHPNLLAAIGRVDDHPDGIAALVLPRLPADWRPLAAPPSFATCSRDVYEPSLVLPPGAACRVARAMAEAGAHLSASGVLHGDLYAHNIHWDGDTGAAMLGDLGAATRVRPEGFDVLAWGILAAELLARAPAADANATLGELSRAALVPRLSARPRFADIAHALAGACE